MLRRKLFAYTCMLVVGIAAGFLFAEREEILKSAALLISIGYVISRIKIDSKCDTNREKIILFSVMLAGFVIFILSYAQFNADILDSKGRLMDISEISEISGVITKAESKDDGYRLTVITDEPIEEKLQLNYYSELDINNTCKLIGRRIIAHGKLKEVTKQRNPKCFDYSVYLKSKGIRHTFSAKSLEIKKYDDSWLWKYRRRLMEKRLILEQSFDGNPEIKAFVKGTVFGDKSEIDDEVIEEFNENSTGHILAVSGLHIGFLYALLKILSRKRRTAVMSVAIIAVILLYGEMTLWSSSTIRAVVVMSISLMSTHLMRRSDLLTSISAAAMLILIVNPYQLFNSGFQMSFLAMMGISFLAEPLSYLVGDYCSMLLAVQLAVAPYTAYTFNRYNLLSIFINIPIVFIASIMVPCCLVQLGIISIFGNYLELLNSIIEILSEFILKLNNILNMNGAFSNRIVSLNTGALICIYLLMFLISSEWFRVKLIRQDKKHIRRIAALMLVPCICMVICYYNDYQADSIVFVDVGQGACVHIRVKEGLFREKNYLIDGGGNEEYNIGKNTLEAYLLKNRVRHIDIAFVTHLHTDHYKGICELSQEGMIDGIIVYEGNQLIEDEIAEETGLSKNQISFMSGGETCLLDEAEELSKSKAYLKALWPKKAGKSTYQKMLAADDENSMSLVFKLTIDELSVIITGDLDEKGEKELVDEYGEELKSNILSVGHHGSRYSCCDDYIDAVSPDIAVIQVGQNIYGHPTEETLDRLRVRKIAFYRNDKQGAIGIRVNKGRLRAIHTMLDFNDAVG